MNAPPATTTIQTTAPIALWRIARAFLVTLHTLFGDPSNIAAQHTLTLKAHQLMASWLRAGEAMMRRLLLIEAAAFTKTTTPPKPRAPRQRAHSAADFNPYEPEQWRVSFRCFVSTRGLSPSKAAEHLAAFPQVQRLPFKQQPDAAARARAFIHREEINTRGLSLSQAGKRDHHSAPRRDPILRQDREWVLHQEPQRFRGAKSLAMRYEALLRAFNNPAPYARRLSRRLHATPHRVRDVLRACRDAEHRIERFTDFDDAARPNAPIFNTS